MQDVPPSILSLLLIYECLIKLSKRVMVGGGGTGTRASSQSLTKEEKSSAQFLQNALLLNHFTCHLYLSLSVSLFPFE